MEGVGMGMGVGPGLPGGVGLLSGLLSVRFPPVLIAVLFPGTEDCGKRLVEPAAFC